MNFGNLESFILFWVFWGGLWAVVHIAFAYGVFMDADLMKRRTNKDTVLVSKGMWTIATLLGGVFIASIYWLIHHSTFNPSNSNNQ